MCMGQTCSVWILNMQLRYQHRVVCNISLFYNIFECGKRRDCFFFCVCVCLLLSLRILWLLQELRFDGDITALWSCCLNAPYFSVSDEHKQQCSPVLLDKNQHLRFNTPEDCLMESNTLQRFISGACFKHVQTKETIIFAWWLSLPCSRFSEVAKTGQNRLKQKDQEVTAINYILQFVFF